MGKNKKCCGTCKWHRWEEYEYYCDNEDSDYYSLESEYEDCCEAWEQKKISYALSDYE